MGYSPALQRFVSATESSETIDGAIEFSRFSERQSAYTVSWQLGPRTEGLFKPASGGEYHPIDAIWDWVGERMDKVQIGLQAPRIDPLSPIKHVVRWWSVRVTCEKESDAQDLIRLLRRHMAS